MKMSLFALIAFTFIASAQARDLRSIEECTVDLYKSNPGKRSYLVEGSRKTGLGANRMVNRIRQNNGKTSEHKDILGVKRYEIFTLRTLLDSTGSIDSCRGLVTASELQLCTSVSNNSTCETRCEIQWMGPDCR